MTIGRFDIHQRGIVIEPAQLQLLPPKDPALGLGIKLEDGGEGVFSVVTANQEEGVLVGNNCRMGEGGQGQRLAGQTPFLAEEVINL